MPQHFRFCFAAALALAALGLQAAPPASAQQPASASAQQPAPAPGCPRFGWDEGLSQYQGPNAAFPTEDTKPDPNNPNAPIPDCNFHQWSYEAFVWATWLDSSGVPRFMTLPTEEDLLCSGVCDTAAAVHPRALKLGARSIVAEGSPGFSEGAGAFVQADGNVLIAPNGYPVYTSVHMNPAYFATAKQNLIVNGGYQSQPQGSTFPVGAAVFKATWLRLDPGEQPPKGAFTTQAEVPVLTVQQNKTAKTVTILPTGRSQTVTVALVGLHVVGVTVNHPEFLWGTFEHQLNTPAVPDNTFPGSYCGNPIAPNCSNPNNFTLYKANTSFSQVNYPEYPVSSPPPAPPLNFDPTTQKFSPSNNAVLENRTGGENQPNGPGNVLAVSAEGQSFLANEKLPPPPPPQQSQSIFANYYLVGTVWMLPNSYNITSNQNNAVGSVSLANTTAETFEQYPEPNPFPQGNCFLCHNPASYNANPNPSLPKLAYRLIAISHALGVGTPYAVPNLLAGPVPPP